MKMRLAWRTDMKVNGKRHGTKSTYNNHGCRCSRCRKANAAAQMAYQREHGRRPIAEVNAERAAAVKHGSWTMAHVRRCRCKKCRAFSRDAKRIEREKYHAAGLTSHGRQVKSMTMYRAQSNRRVAP